MAVRPIPAGYHSVTPYLVLRGAAAAIDFYKEAFGAVETVRLPMPDGAVAHAEIRIGDSVVMLGEEGGAALAKSPHALGGTPVGLCVYVDDCDAVFARAAAAGAAVTRPVADQFYGDRSGTVTDPFGHLWTIATHIEDVTAAEMKVRMAAMTAQPGAA